jgi:hypothetical protein
MKEWVTISLGLQDRLNQKQAKLNNDNEQKMLMFLIDSYRLLFRRLEQIRLIKTDSNNLLIESVVKTIRMYY